MPMKGGFTTFIKFIAIFCIVLFLLSSLPSTSAQSSPELSMTVQAFDKDLIRQHVRFFSSLYSRVTGYPGFYNASNYIIQILEKYNIRTIVESYDITIPSEYDCSISLPNGTILKAHAIWPNDVTPPHYQSPEGGDDLVYIGNGAYEDYTGKNVIGKLVLMKENSLWYFRIAALYGAKGVIYIQDDTTTREEALQKYIDVPLNFPRLYVEADEGQLLLSLLKNQDEIKVNIKVDVNWVKASVPNIVGYIEGKGPHAGETIVLCAYYDSWSIVPSLSPGATDSLGIATLLEVARFFGVNPPDRSMIILAVSGHWEGLWGAREWVDSHFNEIGSAIKLFLGLDLSSGSDQVGVYYAGVTYPYLNPASLRAKYSWLVDRLFGNYLPSLQNFLGSTTYGQNFVDHVFLAYPNYIKEDYPLDFSNTLLFDSDPFVVASYGGGITFHTTNDIRTFMKTPIDTYERINFDNLWPQVQFILSCAWGLANESEISVVLFPTRFGTVDWGFSNLIVRTTIYNMTTAYWDTITKERNPEFWSRLQIIVHVTFTGSAALPGGLNVPTIAPGGIGAYIDVMDIPNEKGEVLIKGLKPYTTGRVIAYAINKTTSNIEWATDFGTFQAPPTGITTTITDANYIRMVAIFPCASVSILSLYNPLTFATPTPMELLIYNHLSHGPMIHQSVVTSSFYGDLMAFIEPNTSTEILIPFAGSRFPYGLLVNATSDKPDGYGYVLGQGVGLRLNFTSLALARNLYDLNEGRIAVLKGKNAFNPIIGLFHGLSGENLNQSEMDLMSDNLGEVYGLSYASLALEYRSYGATLDLIFQVINTALYFFILLIPFSFILQNMLFTSESIKRLLQFIVIFAVSTIVLGFFHAGYHIATNIYMVILSFIMLAVIMPTIIFIFSTTYESVVSFEESFLGRHTSRISVGGALSHSFSASIRFMKRRKFRTLLTAVSITLILFSLISFTSIYLTPTPRTETRSSESGQIPSNSILIRNFPWSSFTIETYFQLETQYRGIADVAPRGWFVVPSTTGAWGSYVFSPSRTTTINAFLYISPKEESITQFWGNIGLKGRGFLESDVYTCMISERAATNLTRELGRSITLGSKIPIWGMNLTVVGIYDGDLLWSGTTGILDLDAEPVTPVMPIPGISSQVRPPHFDGNRIFILPFNLALHTREFFSFMSISLKPYNMSSVQNLATTISLRLSTDTYYRTSNNSNINIVRYREWFSVTGTAMLIIPLILGCLTIFDITLGTVYERTREISIYMSVGLSPLNVSAIFLAEVSIYAVLSSVIGYIAGMVGTSVLQAFKLYPADFYPNYSSVFVLLMIGTSMVMILVSAAYPLSKVASLVTPSMERRWRISKPKKDSDEWLVPFPFVAQEQELPGVLAYIKEFFDLHTSERIGSFAMEDLKFERSDEKEKETVIMNTRVRLAPFDHALVQDVYLSAIRKLDEDRYTFSVTLFRLSGLRDVWISSNRSFLNDVRRQMLMWRTLSVQEKNKYVSQGINLLKDLLKNPNGAGLSL